MQRIFFLVIGFTLLHLNVFSQDLLIFNNGDSINCKIVKQDSKYVHIKKGRDSRVHSYQLADIKKTEINYYKVSNINTSNSIDTKPSGFLRISVQGGLSYLQEKDDLNTPAWQQKYYKQLRHGKTINGSISYIFPRGCGFGFNYSRYMSKANAQDVPFYYNNYSSIRLDIQDSYTINYFAPSLYVRSASANQKVFLIAEASCGYSYFRDEAFFLNYYVVTGKSLCYGASLGLDFLITKEIALGFGIGAINGFLQEVTIYDGKKATKINLPTAGTQTLSHLNINAGLKFYIK